MGNLSDRILTAFTELDRQGGSHNLVNLADLREQLPDVPRVDFDQTLNDFRDRRILSCAGAEGRGGISSLEQQAAIVEGGQLLLYVSKREK